MGQGVRLKDTCRRVMKGMKKKHTELGSHLGPHFRIYTSVCMQLLAQVRVNVNKCTYENSLI